ncbi:MAG: hypothetical protein WBG90_12350 [Saonia sp.]
MRTVKVLLSTIMIFALSQGIAQTENTSGTMNTTVTKTFNVEKNGTKIPYKVMIQENRMYTSKFDKSDEGKVDQDRMSTPARVAKLIVVRSEVDDTYNRFIVLRYDKQVTDTFKLTSTDKGFAVKVDDKTVEYIIGEGIYFANTADEDFFVVDEFDMIQ